MNVPSIRLVFASLLIPVLVTTVIPNKMKREDETRVRVGIFDSRALALAYYRSSEFNAKMKALRKEHTDAKEAGNEARVKELEEFGPAQQQLMHKQGFGTWPVKEIVSRLKDELPRIATKTDVQVIVSKWDIVYQAANFELVDVTDEMVLPFEPSKETLQMIADIRKKAPVSNEELENHID